jgi:hypothetical protein
MLLQRRPVLIQNHLFHDKGTTDVSGSVFQFFNHVLNTRYHTKVLALVRFPLTAAYVEVLVSTQKHFPGHLGACWHIVGNPCYRLSKTGNPLKILAW